MCGLLPCVLPASMSPSHWADSDSLLGQTALPQPLPTNSVPPNGFCPRVFRERQEMTTVESPCLSSGVSGLQGHKLTRCLFFPFLVPVDSYADNSSMPFGHNSRQNANANANFQILFSNKRPGNCLLSQELSRFSNKIMQHRFIMTAQNITKILASPRWLQTGKLRTENG